MNPKDIILSKVQKKRYDSIYMTLAERHTNQLQQKSERWWVLSGKEDKGPSGLQDLF